MKIIATLFLTLAICLTTLSAIPSSTVDARGPNSGGGAGSRQNCDNVYFLTFPAWYRGLTKPGSCEIQSPKNNQTGLQNFLLVLAINIVEILFQLVAYLSAGFIIYGGFLYMTGRGQSDNITRARKMITNAVVGLILALGAITVTTFAVSMLQQGAGNVDVFNIPRISGDALLANILTLVYYFVAVVAVLSIIGGGIMYITSNGESNRVTQAKNIILYAVIGLFITIVAFTITQFIIGRF